MRFFLLLSSVLLSLSFASAQTFRAAPQSEVRFEAIARPSLLNIKGVGGKLRGVLEVKEQAASGRFEVETASFTTDIALRDNHLREKYLKTKEHPKARFILEPVSLPADWKPGQDVKTKFTGRMNLVGVTKPISGEISVEGASMKTEAKFPLKLSDFGIEAPKYMGLTVNDVVNVEVSVPAFVIAK